jgi:plasmid stabilization system protein ParE
MARAVWTTLAIGELEDLITYIAVESGRPETARRLGDQIREAADRTANVGFPRLKMNGTPDDWFYVKFKRWLIFCRERNGRIEVQRIVDASRDLPSILESRPD